jgi:hypothetical protein
MKNKILVVGLIGNIRVGKDTVANIFKQEAEKIDIKLHIQPLALEMKNLLCEICGLTLEELEELKVLENVNVIGNNSVRKALQSLGQGLKKVLETDDIWCLLAFNKIKEKQLEGYKVFVIPDIRLQHEIDCLKKVCDIEGWDFKTVKIIRPNLNNKDNHITEKAVLDLKGDLVLKNDKSLDVLKVKSRRLFYQLIKGDL